MYINVVSCDAIPLNSTGFLSQGHHAYKDYVETAKGAMSDKACEHFEYFAIGPKKEFLVSDRVEGGMEKVEDRRWKGKVEGGR